MTAGDANTRLEGAFLQLIKEKPFAKITVNDIVEKAGVHRNTFYYHYQSIPAMLSEMCRKKAEEIITVLIRCIIKLRKIFMAVPVVWVAVQVAGENMERLPEMVGFNIQSNGEFAVMVTRNYAVAGPLGLTAFCLLLMFCSRKTVFPWIISIFSLALPWLIYYTNLIA